jgi:hypothetical protein
MTFEDTDVREMLVEHFARAGFTIRNLDVICKSFEDAYPGGLTVAVTTNETDEDSPPKRTTSKPSTIDAAERPLTAAELSDPEHHIRDDTDESIESILKKSSALQRTK